MKKIFIILLVVTVGMVSCAKIQEKEIANESAPSVFLPKPIDDDWSNRLVGEWEGSGESNAGKGKGWVEIELGLNGQFLIMKGEAEITQMTPEQKQYLKETLHATDEDKEIMQWQWSGSGQGTSTRITEKVSDNKLIMTEKYTLPDGGTMEDKGEMTRKKLTTENKIWK